MTRFLRTEDDTLINADQISQIEQIEPDDQGRCKATLIDGSVVWFSGGLDRIERQLCHTVAAPPGYTALRYVESSDGSEPFVIRSPVVAWRITGDTALPVVPDREGVVNLDITKISILTPDGRVFQWGVQSSPNEENWRAEMDRRSEVRREQERAKPKLRNVIPIED
jgi:hypothetical protein